MADLRIHEYPDEQTSYAENLYLAVDINTYTSSHKMKVSAIYPKVDQLSPVGSVTLSTSVVRINNGAGVEEKSTLTNLRSLIAPLINNLSAASSINTATYLLQLNDGSGTEEKITIDDFLAEFGGSETYTPTYNSAGDTMGNFRITKFKDMVVGQFENQADRGNTVFQLYTDAGATTELTLPSIYRPSTKITHFQPNENNYDQQNIIEVDTAGKVFVQAKNSGQDYGFCYTVL